MSRLAFSLSTTKVFVCDDVSFLHSFFHFFTHFYFSSKSHGHSAVLSMNSGGVLLRPFRALSLTSNGLCQSLNPLVPQRPMDGDDNHAHPIGLSGWSDYLWDTSSSSWQRVRTVYKNKHNFLRSPATKSDCFLSSLLLPVTQADFLCKCRESMFLTPLLLAGQSRHQGIFLGKLQEFALSLRGH